jgi:hypothetical protein
MSVFPLNPCYLYLSATCQCALVHKLAPPLPCASSMQHASYTLLTYMQSNRATTTTGTHAMATAMQQHDCIRDAQLRLQAPCQQHRAMLLPPNPLCHPITPPSCSPRQAARARPGRDLVACAVMRSTRKSAQADHRRPPVRRCRRAAGRLNSGPSAPLPDESHPTARSEQRNYSAKDTPAEPPLQAHELRVCIPPTGRTAFPQL